MSLCVRRSRRLCACSVQTRVQLPLYQGSFSIFCLIPSRQSAESCILRRMTVDWFAIVNDYLYQEPKYLCQVFHDSWHKLSRFVLTTRSGMMFSIDELCTALLSSKGSFEIIQLIVQEHRQFGVTHISQTLSINKSTVFGILKASTG